MSALRQWFLFGAGSACLAGFAAERLGVAAQVAVILPLAIAAGARTDGDGAGEDR